VRGVPFSFLSAVFNVTPSSFAAASVFFLCRFFYLYIVLPYCVYTVSGFHCRPQGAYLDLSALPTVPPRANFFRKATLIFCVLISACTRNTLRQRT